MSIFSIARQDALCRVTILERGFQGGSRKVMTWSVTKDLIPIQYVSANKVLKEESFVMAAKKKTKSSPLAKTGKTATGSRKSVGKKTGANSAKTAGKRSGSSAGPSDNVSGRCPAEAHQQADSQHPTLTTAQGVAVSDNQNTLTVGPRGPQLLEDQVLREKIFRFDHERIPERVVHARGFGAKGYFIAEEGLADTSRASVFKPGQKTDVFVRFSTVAGNKGSADLARDVRGFAVKFYTDEGNWDLVGNNIPVFFIQDAMKFPDLVHAAKQEPDRGFPQAQTAHDNFWDFISLMPEAMHMIMWTMSDRAIPRGFRFMEGFGVHTFRLIDAAGRSTYVKFHWKPSLGVQSVTWDEAVKINGADPDFHRRDLWNAIQAGDYPEWTLGVQLFDDDFADQFDFDILDATKLIPEEILPVQPVGRMVLNQTVDNFFAETEQVAFCTSNVVPGIDFTNDPLLQGRNFSYLDTQLKRLGSPNFTQIPVNAPRCPMAHLYQDGHMAMQNPKGRVNYEPNSHGGEAGPRENPERGFVSYPETESGQKVRQRSESFADHFSQARQFFHSQTDVEQQHMVDALVFELSKVEREAIRHRMVSMLQPIDETLARQVASGLGIETLPDAFEPPVAPRDDLAKSPALSMLLNPPGTFKGRKLGVLTGNGADAGLLRALERAARKAGATVSYVASQKEGVKDSEGNAVDISEIVDGGPSVLFDAVAIIAPDSEIEMLAKEPAAIQFVNDAVSHKKFVLYTSPARDLFAAAGMPEAGDKPGMMLMDKAKVAKKFIEQCSDLRCWER